MTIHTFRFLAITLLISVLLGVSSCKKDEPAEPTPSGNGGSITTGALSSHTYQSGTLIEANFRGLIRDVNSQPIQDVEVHIGSSLTYTNAEGIWQIIDVMVDNERAYIRAEKDGYFHGSRVLTPTDIGFNRAFITLMTAQTVGSVSSATGGEVSHSSGSMISLPADSYVDENGGSYNGMVDVQMCYLDPSNLDILEQMPGNLTALEDDNDFVALQTYGMIGVELKGTGGQSLQLASGANAEVHVVVPPEGLDTAPTSIPLWHFDEIEGVWREDGSATLVGNEYVGEVSHFSFWNCDIPADFVFLDGYAMGEEAAFPVQGVQILILSEEFGYGASYTDQEGYFGGFIPGNVPLTLEVYSPCGELLSSQEIGPFNSDETIPVIAIFEEAFGSITGTFIDCDGEPGEGFISLTNFGFLPESYEVAADGEFEMNLGCAPQDLNLIGYSLDYLNSSETIAVTTIPGEVVEIGTVDLCAQENEDEYIVFTVLGETYSLVDYVSTYNENESLGIYAQSAQNGEMQIEFGMDESSAPPSSSFWGSLFTNDGVNGGINEQTSIMDWDFITYSLIPGEYLEFTFTCSFYISSDTSQGFEEVTGYGRVQRD